jgi:tetratricopeptide (TPR) repeat protein
MRLGLAAAQRVGSTYAQSRMNRFLGASLLMGSRYDEAEHYIREALRFDVEAGEVRSVLNVSVGLAFILEKQERHEEALEALLEVHPLVHNHDVPYDVGSLLGALGRAYLRVGDVDRAFEFCERSVEAFAGLDKLVDSDASHAHETLAEIHLRFGRYAEAVRHLSEAARLHRVMKHVGGLIDVLVPLAKAHIAAGDHASARECLAEQVALCEEAGYGDAEEARQLLASLD